jgi:hypothetical protein
MITIVRAVETCSACPSQWDAWDEAGNFYYLRYRSGYGEMRCYKTPDWYQVDADELRYIVAEFEHGDPFDGVISLEKFAELAGVELSPDLETSTETRLLIFRPGSIDEVIPLDDL